jgi:L-threonylcarbamoyladenylate synthase
MSRCLTVDPHCPDPMVLQEAIAILQQGGVVAYPTDTVYGLAVDTMNPQAIARLYVVKQRPMAKALPVIIGSLEHLALVVTRLSPSAERLIAAFWPGPLTLLMTPHAHMPSLLLGDSRCLGVRWPHSILSQQLASGLGRAITATSANLAGAPVACTAAEVLAQLAPRIDLILDGGPTPSTEVSTVLDVTVEPPCLHRAGKICSQALESVLGSKIVCMSSSPAV